MTQAAFGGERAVAGGHQRIAVAQDVDAVEVRLGLAAHMLLELLHRLDRRRVQLQDRAFALGSRLFADQPTVFAQQLSKHFGDHPGDD